MAKHPRWRDGLFPDKGKISTKSVFESTNDNITSVLNHEIMLNAGASIDDASSPAGQILRSIIQSARCQTTEQLLMRWFSPFKRTRSHVRRSLMGTVRDVIISNGPNNEPNPNAGQDRIKNFRGSVDQKLFNKNYQIGINNGVQAITHNAIRDFKQSLASIEEALPKSVYKSPNELYTKKASYEKAESQRKQDQMQHRSWKKELGLDMTGAGSVRSSNAANSEADSSLYSSELASTPGYGRSRSSNRSENSTILTMPEMESSVSSVKLSPTLPQLEDKKNRPPSNPSPLSPLSPISISNSTELGSTPARHRRRVVSEHNKTPTNLPPPRKNEKSTSWISKVRELPQVEINDAPSPQPPSRQSVPNSAALPQNPNPAHNRHPVSNSGSIFPAFSPPEIDNNISPQLSPLEFYETNPWAKEQPPSPPQPVIHTPASPPLSPSPISTPIPHVPTRIPPVTPPVSHVSALSDNFSLSGDPTAKPILQNENRDMPDEVESHVPVVPVTESTYKEQNLVDEDVDMPVWDDYDDEDLRIDWTGDANGDVTVTGSG